MIDPENDGYTHINVYSKGRTQLGRMLSNFAATPFEIEGLTFASVEAWWYWQMMEKDDAHLRTLTGWQAKKYGKNLWLPHKAPTKAALKRVYLRKVQKHKGIFSLLIHSELPLEHYYVYFGKAVDTKWLWTAKLWEEIRQEYWDTCRSREELQNGS